MKTICSLLGDKTKPLCPVIEHDGGLVTFTADADIDADGAYRAYHPDDKSGLDDLRNARTATGEWCGIVASAGGHPIIQGPMDPAPGFYVSPTTLQNKDFPRTNPRRYVDAETVPFIVVSPLIIKGVLGVVMGCKARITNTLNGKTVDAVVADVGPLRKAGEISIAAAKALGIPSSARTGGEDRNVVLYELWPGLPAVVLGVKYQLQPS